jgi:hypothetical protein
VTWVAHTPHKHSTDSKQFYTYTLRTPDNEEYYAAYIIHNDNGYQATVPMRGMKQAEYYHYTHDTLQEAKDWCIAELWKRRLDQ